jgi:adenylate cyclase
MHQNALFQWLQRFGERPDDSVEVRTQKRTLVVISTVVAILAVGWGFIYLILGEPLAALIPWTYSVGAVITLALFGVSGHYRTLRFVQLLLILLLPFLLQITLGGFVNASAVIIWSLLAPLGALATAGRREAVSWFMAYAGLVLVAQLVQPSLAIENNLPISAVAGFFIANIVAATGVAFFALNYFVGQKDEVLNLLELERSRSDRLLLNVLPREIAEKLKEQEGRVIAERHDDVSILFADLVGFTTFAEGTEAEDVVAVLNDVFSYFDSLVETHGLEKIRTMGDAYMVASGVPVERPDHAVVLARLALQMFEYSPAALLPDHPQLQFRVGISSGPVVAGVIGTSKFQYDVWGDTVNTASRMETQGIPGRIQLSESAHALLAPMYECEPRGVIDVKGKGPMDTWFLIGSNGAPS